MSNLFDKAIGTTTSFDAAKVTDSTADWVANYYKGWFVILGSTEYLITANTATELYFANAIVANSGYTIQFVGRTFLTEIESDFSNTTKIPDALIAKKYNQTNVDINNKIFAYLKPFFVGDFNPMDNILNLISLQQSFAYYLAAKVYQDLSIDQDSFESFKGYNMYEKSYNDGIKDSMAMLQLDKNQDGTANAEEIRNTISSSSFFKR